MNNDVVCKGSIYLNNSCMKCSNCLKAIEDLKSKPVNKLDDNELKTLQRVLKHEAGVERKKKNLLLSENVEGVWTKKVLTSSVVASFKNKAKKYRTCANCKTPFESLLDEYVSLLFPKSGLNTYICEECAKKLIEQGVRNIGKEREDYRMKKESLIEKLKEFGWRKPMWGKSLEEYDVEDLEKMVSRMEEEKREEDRIEAITFTEEELFMEEYLTKDFNVLQDSKWLKCEEQIESYFKEMYADYFECGQGFHQNEAEVLVKIGFNFYKVTIYAEILSSKQDRGDRLYWVESVEKVEWEEIPKPKPLERSGLKLYIKDITDDEIFVLKKYMLDKKWDVEYD